MNNFSKALGEPYECRSDQDSYIAITEERIVAAQCPADADLIPWMAHYPDHHFLITSTAQAMNMIGKPLPDGNIEVMLL